MTFDRDEVEAAFRTYWALGAVGEDWDAWCDECFTEDVTYVEHILGSKDGREAVRAWIKPTMEDYGEIYTAYEWHMVGDDGRVVVYMQNRRDNPEPGARRSTSPASRCSSTRATDSSPSKRTSGRSRKPPTRLKRYVAACKEHDRDFRKQRTRRNWGNGPDWTQGAASYAARKK